MSTMIGFGMVLLILAGMPRLALCAEVKPVCPSLTGVSGFKSDEVLTGVVEFTADESSKPVSGAQITVRCILNGRVVARVETDPDGRYAVPGMQFGIRYSCSLDPRIPGYLQGETSCITRALFDWQISKGVEPVVTACSPASWPHKCHGHEVRSYHTFDPDSADVEISGWVGYDGTPPFKRAPGATMQVCSASNKLLGHARTDAQGYYELHIPKDLLRNSGRYICVLHPSAADSSAGYSGGVANCHANNWFLTPGQTPRASDAPVCDLVGPCPEGAITPVAVHPLTAECLP
jgi:hypothetical protein